MQSQEPFFRTNSNPLIPQYCAGKFDDKINDQAIAQYLSSKTMNLQVVKVHSEKVFGKFNQEYSFDQTLSEVGPFIQSQIRQNPILEDENQALQAIFAVATLCRGLNAQNSMRSLQNRQVHHTIRQIMLRSKIQIPIQFAQIAHSIGTIKTQRGIIESLTPVIDVDTEFYRACVLIRQMLTPHVQQNINQNVPAGAKILLNDIQVSRETQELFKHIWNKNVTEHEFDEQLQVNGQFVNYHSYFPEVNKFIEMIPNHGQQVQWIQNHTQPGVIRNEILAIHALATDANIPNIQATNVALQNTGYHLVNVTRQNLQAAVLQAIDVYTQQIQPGILSMKPVTFDPSSQGQLSQLVNRDTEGILPRYSVVTPVTQLDMYLGVIQNTRVEVTLDDFYIDTGQLLPFQAMQIVETNSK